MDAMALVKERARMDDVPTIPACIPAARAGSLVGDNEPHSVTDASGYTIPVHGEQRDLHHVAIEIR
jgi:predicted N-formylglutamate amidohydrolase